MTLALPALYAPPRDSVAAYDCADFAHGADYAAIRGEESLVTSANLMRELTAYVSFDAEDAALLIDARPALATCFPEVVDAFYVAIEAQPRAHNT